MHTVTVLTPTYNRAHLLHSAYESLCRQTNNDFVWLIIDDGSKDNTKQLVDGWIKEHKIDIEYLKKENGGKHTCLNIGFKKVESDYIIILDSDDFLSDDAVDKIIKAWAKYKDDNEVAAIVFLRAHHDDTIIGCKATEYKKVSLPEIERMGFLGDKAETFRTSIIRNYQFPVFEGERFIGETIIWNQLAIDYKFIFINEIIYYCEYLDGGLTDNGLRMRLHNPKGMQTFYAEKMRKPHTFKIRLKNSILYGIYCILLGQKFSEIYANSNAKFLTFITYPVSLFLYHYWHNKYLKEDKK